MKRRSDIWMLLVAKELGRAKQRLAPALSDQARSDLAEAMLRRALAAVAELPLGRLVVATDGDDVAALARAAGAEILPDPPGGGIAEVVRGGVAALAARGAPAVVVLMADLPEVRPADVAALLTATAHGGVALAPSHDGGTNGLGLRPPRPALTCFGHTDSAARHRRAAADAGLPLREVRRQGLAFDIDRPEDLRRARGAEPQRAGVGPRRDAARTASKS